MIYVCTQNLCIGQMCLYTNREIRTVRDFLFNRILEDVCFTSFIRVSIVVESRRWRSGTASGWIPTMIETWTKFEKIHK